MGKAPTKPVSGMRDHLPAAALTRREAFRRVETAFAAHGFVPLETPAMERLSTLLGKYGEEGDQLIYRVLHRGERLARALGRQPVEPGDLSELGLRYDLTVPLARVTAEYRAQLPAVFRRYQIQSVWRADRAQRGRFREFTQCDADIVGSSSLLADIETLIVLHATLSALGFSDFTILLNHRELLRGLIAASGIPAHREQDTLVVLDKIGKIGREAVKDELASLEDVESDHASRLLDLVSDNATDHARDVDQLKNLLPGLPIGPGQDSVVHLIGLLEALYAALGEDAPVRFSPTLARGLSYYTGPIFEVVAAGGTGSLAGGGRYDGLVGMFSGRATPAVGFSLGMERILMLLEKDGTFSAAGAATQAMLCPHPALNELKILPVARQLRTAGVRLEIQVDSLRLGKQLSRAAAAGVPFALILGQDELDNDCCTVRNLKTGEQRTVPLAEVPDYLNP